MFAVTVHFTTKPGQEEAFLTRVRKQAEDSLTLEAQCRRFDVAQDPANSARIFLYELYDDAAAFDVHLASAHYAAFSEEAAPMLEDKRIDRWTLIA